MTGVQTCALPISEFYQLICCGFQSIQKISSSLSCGHQAKREVDFILDQCFETSSMMHYHTREEIFVIVKKVRFKMVPATRSWTT